MEHAKTFTTEQSRKWVSDSLKVVKVLHDMLYHLESRVNHSLEVLRRIPVVGLVAGGRFRNPSAYFRAIILII